MSDVCDECGSTLPGHYGSCSVVAKEAASISRAMLGPEKPPPVSRDTSETAGGAPEWCGADAAKRLAADHRKVPPVLQPGTVEYWRQRAISAEEELARVRNRLTDQGWELDNHREEARRRRDAEIGEMGGGG